MTPENDLKSQMKGTVWPLAKFSNIYTSTSYILIYVVTEDVCKSLDPEGAGIDTGEPRMIALQGGQIQGWKPDWNVIC